LSIVTGLVLVWFHIQAVAAFWSFSWTNLLVAAALYWVSIGLGISMGYHRLHTHRGFKTYRLFEYFLAVCGTLTLEGGPIFWVATHRVHHQHSDQAEDPHTPPSGRTSAGSCSATRSTTTPRAWRGMRRTWRRIRSTAGCRPITGCR
jgi:stearoyl-CoA desaturase (delta-9 desaturase)